MFPLNHLKWNYFIIYSNTHSSPEPVKHHCISCISFAHSAMLPILSPFKFNFIQNWKLFASFGRAFVRWFVPLQFAHITFGCIWEFWEWFVCTRVSLCLYHSRSLYSDSAHCNTSPVWAYTISERYIPHDNLLLSSLFVLCVHTAQPQPNQCKLARWNIIPIEFGTFG